MCKMILHSFQNFHEYKFVRYSLWIYLTIWFFHCCVVTPETVTPSDQVNTTELDSMEIKVTSGNVSDQLNTTELVPTKTKSANNSDNELESLVEAPGLRSKNETVTENETGSDPINLSISRHTAGQDITPLSNDVRFKGSVNNIRVTTSSPPETEVLDEDDKKARNDWGGNCKNKHWLKCSNVTWFGDDKFDKANGKKIGERLSCANETLFPPVCLFNGWTVTRCHLICLAKECNKDLKIHYDKYVSKDGFC